MVSMKTLKKRLQRFGNIAFFIIVIGTLLSALFVGLSMLFLRFALHLTPNVMWWIKWTIGLIAFALCFALVRTLFYDAEKVD